MYSVLRDQNTVLSILFALDLRESRTIFEEKF